MSANPQFITRPATSQRQLWHTPAVVVGCLAVVVLVFWSTTVSMVAIWERSETFTHGFLVLPVFLYLLWAKRAELRSLDPQPYYPALLGIAAAGCIWLTGQLAAAVSVSQFGMMLMVPFAVWTLLGTRITAVLIFPLAFLFFAVPFGEVLVPHMMDWTADFTVLALKASGVPVFREGNYFMIPSGRWSVVEACSGLRYLIASLMIGCLFAVLMFRSTRRRIAFVAASLIVPIIANWLRAYGVVMLAHLTNNRLATGIDHLIYGWIFFGIVMLVLFQVGSWWREDTVQARDTARESVPEASTLLHPRTLSAGLIVVALIAIWQPLRAAIENRHPPASAAPVVLAGNGGWLQVPGTLTAWRPDIHGATVESTSVFEKNGVRVGVFLALFTEQTFDARAITSSNKLVDTTNRQWRYVDRGVMNASFDGRPAATDAGLVVGHDARLAAWRWYWVDGRLTTSDVMAKLYQVASKLRGHGDPTAWIVLYTPAAPDEAAAYTALQSFVTEMSPTIDAAIFNASGSPPSRERTMP